MKKIKIFLGLVMWSLLSTAFAADNRQVLVCVSQNASESIKKAASELLAVDLVVPLAALYKSGSAFGQPSIAVSENLLEKQNFNLAAYNTLVIVGLKNNDPLLEKCWGHQAAVDVTGKQFYRLGYGRFHGDIGYVESDWNPFLFSNKVKNNAFTTLCTRISGTSEAGVLAAVKEFKQGMLNGVVPAGELVRVEKSILDLAPSVAPPMVLPDEIKVNGLKLFRSGWTQPAANEYRAFIDAGGCEPVSLWRIKYLASGVFDDVSGKAWVNGLHRMAYGNAINIARFRSDAEAGKVYNGIASMKGALKVTVDGIELIRFNQPKDDAFTESYGKVDYWKNGYEIISFSIPEDAIKEFKALFIH